MNRYVVLLKNVCKESNLMISYPVKTDMIRETLLLEIEVFFSQMLQLDDDDPDRKKTLNIEGSDLRLGFDDVAVLRLADDGQYYYDFAPPPILTVDEWFGVNQ